MPSKKAIIISSAVIAGLVLVGLIPVFMYGFSVTGTEINLSMGLSSGFMYPYASNDQGDTQGGWDATWNLPPEANVRAINAYEYAMSKLRGNMDTEEEESNLEIPVSIVITFNLTTPSNTSLYFSFEPTKMSGDGVKDVMILLGPDELNDETGVFYLEITIEISVTIEGIIQFEKVLTPVSLDFTIPDSEAPA